MDTEKKFGPAYDQLRDAEKTFVNQYVANLVNRAAVTGATVSAMLEAQEISADYRAGPLQSGLVRAAITDQVSAIEHKRSISAERTLHELQALAYSNMEDYSQTDAMGQLTIDLTMCNRDQFAAISQFEITEKPGGIRTVKIKLYDKLAALRMLMQYQGLLEGEGAASPGDTRMISAAPADQETAADAYARSLN